jgi:hypothetical protein
VKSVVSLRFAVLSLGLLAAGCADTRLTDGLAPSFEPEVPFFASTD